jgi:hypothetical protein
LVIKILDPEPGPDPDSLEMLDPDSKINLDPQNYQNIRVGVVFSAQVPPWVAACPRPRASWAGGKQTWILLGKHMGPDYFQCCQIFVSIRPKFGRRATVISLYFFGHFLAFFFSPLYGRTFDQLATMRIV